MTRYDPFNYGAVRLDPNTQGEPAAPDAEDFLFAHGENTKQGPPAEDSWGLMEADVSDLLPSGATGSPYAEADSFGAEILGMGTSAPTAPEPAELPSRRRPETGARPQHEEAAVTEPSPMMARERREVRRRELPSVRPVQAPAAPTRRASAPTRRKSRLPSVVMPLVLCGAGAGGSFWLWASQHNPVMAGIVGATTMVGALIAWLKLRQ